jgi:Coenzyme PQQ synthesis protein D (PqqD)
MNSAPNGVWQKNPALAWREIDEETIIISPSESVMHELNDTGSFVWKRIDGRRTAADLAVLLAENYDVTRDVALADTTALLEEFAARKLVVAADGEPR